MMRIGLRLGSTGVCAVLGCSSAHALDDSAISTDSATLDAAALAPTPFAVWRQREPIYELYVRHFSPEGTFKGVEAKLPELRALGIGIIWLLPVNEIGSIVPANGGQATDAPWGNPYAVKAYENVAAEYGSDRTASTAGAELRELVDAAHALDMHVILDWVPNHTAWDNHLVVEHPEWYSRTNGVIQPVAGFPWIAQLDWSRPELRAYMTTVMTTWLRTYDLDGFRIDFAHGMPLDYFSELRDALEAVKPVFMLAEAGDRSFHPAFDMTYDWNVYPEFGDVAHGVKTTAAIDDALLNTQLVPYLDEPDALVMRMTYNHDDNGVFTLAERYLGGIRTFAVLSACLPGKPLLFNGQEAGMRPATPLGHDPSIKLDWSDPDDDRAFYTLLLQTFRTSSALNHPGGNDFRKINTIPGDFPYAFIRRDGANAVLVVVNLSPNNYSSVALMPTSNAGTIDGHYVELFTGVATSLTAGMSLQLAPWEYRVYLSRP